MAVAEARTKIVRPTITMSASPDYSIGDSIGGIITLTDAALEAGRQVKLTSLSLVDLSGQSPAFTIIFFKSTPVGGTYTDNAALDMVTADFSTKNKMLRVLSADWKIMDSVGFLDLDDLNMIMDAVSDDLFALIFADSTWNAASVGDLIAAFGFERVG